MESHHREVDPRKGRRLGGLIEELREAAGRLTDEQRLRLRHHLEDQIHGHQTTDDRRRLEGSDQEIRPQLLRDLTCVRRGTLGDPAVHE